MNPKNILRITAIILVNAFIAGCTGTETPSPELTGNTPTTFKLLAAEDTNSKELFPTQIKGTSEKIDVWNYPNEDKQAFVQFDFSKIPAATKVKKAVFRLWVYDARNPGIIHFYKVSGMWEELSLTYSTLNSLSLGYMFPFRIYASDEHQYVDVDITDLVNGWISGAIVNDGLSIAADESGGYVRVDFHSKDAPVNPSYLELTLE